VALAKTVQVMYDYAAARTIAVPESFKAKVRAFQGDWQHAADFHGLHG
jgi:hypothetical protein